MSPLAPGRAQPDTASSARPGPARGVFGGGLLDSSWTTSWASVQGFAASLLSSGETGYQRKPVQPVQPGSRASSQTRPQPLTRDYTTTSDSLHKLAESWGPNPPPKARPGTDDVAAGSLAKRESALKAARTASVLESHDGVNGGLGVGGRYKRRNSDETARDSTQSQEVEENLVYIHHVQSVDTYAGVILKFKCREDAFRKANGLWSRDNIQVRKWLAIPVEACEVKGRPYEPPFYYTQGMDLLAPKPEASDLQQISLPTPKGHGGYSDDFFSRSTNGSSAERSKGGEETPWVHVRWVSIDTFSHPVEIGRVSRRSLGYFPPRRKKSLHTVSSLSTPRQSLDLSSMGASSIEVPDRAGATSPRRRSLLGVQQQASSVDDMSPPARFTRNRVGSDGVDVRPAWMRRPGGVGSLGRNVRAPGPEKDYLNSWAKKHLPGLNIDSLPSMSVMGSETANFGFGNDSAGIAESPFDDGRNQMPVSRQPNGTGLDRAAAAVETWLRGAFAKRPGTPILGSRGHQYGGGDLIELADTHSDDGRSLTAGGDLTSSRPSDMVLGPTTRSDGESSLRTRVTAPALPKGKRAD